MVFGKFVSEQEDLSIVANLQYQIFREELKLSPAAMEDTFCTHALVFDKDIPVGFGSMSYDGDEFRLVRIGILPENRGQMFGDFLVRLLVDKVMMSGGSVLEADALAGTEDFFKTIGFTVKGPTYEKGGVDWIPMQLLSGSIHKCSGCR